MKLSQVSVLLVSHCGRRQTEAVMIYLKILLESDVHLPMTLSLLSVLLVSHCGCRQTETVIIYLKIFFI